MRKLLSAALVTTTISTGGLVATTTSGAADAPRCVTHKEFKRVHQGMAKSRVERIFGARGEFESGAAGGYTIYYGSCQVIRIGGGDGGAYITYSGENRVLEKLWTGYR